MPFSAGTFTRLHSWVTDAAASLNISSSRMDTDTNDIASGLSSCVLRDGTQTITANIPMNSFKLTGIASGSAATDSAALTQTQAQSMGGRLTLTAATPYLSTSVTNATTVYYTPAVSGFVCLYNGTLWLPRLFTEVSQTLADTTKSPAAAAPSSNYDYFLWLDSSTLRCTRGPVWAADTDRGTGAATTELIAVDGVLMNRYAITNGPAAQRGVYVGSIRTNGSTQVAVNFGAAAGAAGGEDNMVGLWNMFNRAPIAVTNFDNTNFWTYAVAAWQTKNGNAANAITFICGQPGTAFTATNKAHAVCLTPAEASVAISYDDPTVTTPLAQTFFGVNSGTVPGVSIYNGIAGVGFHTLLAAEYAHGGAATTFYGDKGGSFLRSVLTFQMMM